MIAAFDGQDYLIIFDKDKKEVVDLRYKTIESNLIGLSDGKDLGKRVLLEQQDNYSNPDGIEFLIFPLDSKGWDDIKDIHIRLNNVAYNAIRNIGKCGTRYTSSKCIEIYDGDPIYHKE